MSSNNNNNDNDNENDVQAQIAHSIQGMMGLLEEQQEHSYTSYGRFFEDFRRVSTAMDSFVNEEALNQAFGGIDLTTTTSQNNDNTNDDNNNNNNNNIPITTAMKGAMEAHANWLQFIMSHIENGVPMDDPEDWSPDRVSKFLKDHGVTPRPPPPPTMQRNLARFLIQFCKACLVTLDSMPNEEQAEALGRKSMGQATAEDLELIEQMDRRRPVVTTTNTTTTTTMEAQIPPHTQLAALPAWNAFCDCSEPFTILMRIAANTTTKSSSIQGVWLVMEAIASVRELILENGRDYLLIVASDKDTEEEQSIAIRPLGVRTLDGLPLVEFEYTYGTKKDAMKAMETLFAGIRKGTLMQSHEVTAEQMDILTDLFVANSEHLLWNDSNTNHQVVLSKGWKFSVVRPVDPKKRSGDDNILPFCPACGKPASKTCSRCKAVDYCSIDCQKSQWKVHKKECQAPTK